MKLWIVGLSGLVKKNISTSCKVFPERWDRPWDFRRHWGLEIGRQHGYGDKAENWMKILHEGIVLAVTLGSIGQGSLLHKRCWIPKNRIFTFKVTQANFRLPP